MWAFQVQHLFTTGLRRRARSGNRADSSQSARPEDKIDATSGLLALGFGFALQAVAYLWGMSADVETTTGCTEAFLGVTTLVLGFVVVFGLGTALRRMRVVAILIGM